jgi:putative sigma-54 modulation protein
MNYSVDDIKIDLQTVGFDETPELLADVERELRRVMRFRQDIVAADFYLSEDGANPMNNKVARWRLGVPGNDLFAEARSASWSGSLRDAGEKLRRQFVD